MLARQVMNARSSRKDLMNQLASNQIMARIRSRLNLFVIPCFLTTGCETVPPTHPCPDDHTMIQNPQVEISCEGGYSLNPISGKKGDFYAKCSRIGTNLTYCLSPEHCSETEIRINRVTGEFSCTVPTKDKLASAVELDRGDQDKKLETKDAVELLKSPNESAKTVAGKLGVSEETLLVLLELSNQDTEVLDRAYRVIKALEWLRSLGKETPPDANKADVNALYDDIRRRDHKAAAMSINRLLTSQDVLDQAVGHGAQASLLVSQGDYRSAIAEYEQASSLSESYPATSAFYRFQKATSLYNTGLLKLDRHLLQRSADEYRALADTYGVNEIPETRAFMMDYAGRALFQQAEISDDPEVYKIAADQIFDALDIAVSRLEIDPRKFEVAIDFLGRAIKGYAESGNNHFQVQRDLEKYLSLTDRLYNGSNRNAQQLASNTYLTLYRNSGKSIYLEEAQEISTFAFASTTPGVNPETFGLVDAQVELALISRNEKQIRRASNSLELFFNSLTQESYPVMWARAKLLYADAYAFLSRSLENEEYCEDAISAYRDAGRVLYWADPADYQKIRDKVSILRRYHDNDCR